MFFMDITSACSSPMMSGILKTTKNILNFIQLIGPILAICSLTFTFILLVNNPDEKKYVSRIKNSLLALAITFFIPIIVNALFSIMGSSTNLSDCWNNVDGTFNSDAEYIEIGTKKNYYYVYENPNDFEHGTTKPTSGLSRTRNGTSSGSSGNSSGTGNNKSNRVIFIGDSRTVQMYAYLNNNWSSPNFSDGGVHEVGNDVYVAQGSQGLAWMKSTGIPAAQKYFVSGNAIVILMGVNDLSNANNYINYINSNVTSWKSNGSSLYYVSVNPCQGSYSHLNSKITTFNSQLKSGLDNRVGWIDTNSILTNSGFNATDGLHYDKATYLKIYNYIKSNV